MAERQRTFTVGRSEDTPVEFTIACERLTGDKWVPEEHTFVLPSRVPGGVIADLFTAGGGVEAILGFLNGLLPPEEKARFQALVHDHDVAIPANVITEVAYWLVDVYTGNTPDRPTKPRKSSASGSRGNGRGSKAGAR